MLILFGFGLADYLVSLDECIAGELILGKWKNESFTHYII
jgi:hypothetical protein